MLKESNVIDRSNGRTEPHRTPYDIFVICSIIEYSVFFFSLFNRSSKEEEEIKRILISEIIVVDRSHRTVFGRRPSRYMIRIISMKHGLDKMIGSMHAQMQIAIYAASSSPPSFSSPKNARRCWIDQMMYPAIARHKMRMTMMMAMTAFPSMAIDSDRALSGFGTTK